MKKNIFLLILFPFLSFAQVGVNTATPNAALDIQSTNNGILIPRVQLTDALDVATVVNPVGGALTTSTMIYNLAPAGVVPNAVVAGFYYWNGTRWIAMAGTAVADHDWYEEGTTTTPDAITDDMFHTGKVAIGKNTANTTLDLETTNENVGIKNSLIKSTGTGTNYNIDNAMTINSTDSSYGVRNHFLGTGSGDKIGVNNLSDTGVLGSKSGVNNDFTGYNFDNITGVESTLTHIGTGYSYGIYNTLNNPIGSTGLTYGIYNLFDNNSAGMAVGINNQINALSGNGGTFGIKNNISGGKAGGKFGIENNISSTIADTVVGITNNLSSTVDTGSIIGIQNNLTPNSDTLTIGNSNQIGGTGNSNASAVYSFITNSGNGVHTGIFSNLSGAGTGIKYGTFSTINPAAGGQHFGVFAQVLKPGANYAGYFNGKVAIGTNISTGIDDYVFPMARGTNGQIMRTDGTGNLSWQNPNTFSWSLNGNAGTLPPSGFVSAFGPTENFIGTTDNQNLFFGTNNSARLQIMANGGILTGKTNISTVGGPNPNPSLNVYTISTGPGSERFTGSSFNSVGINNGTNIAATFFAGQATNNYAIVVPSGSGLVGIGTATPTTTLHIENPTAGAVRIVDGTQAAGRVLTSDVNGIATWQSLGTIGTAWSVNGNSAISTPTVPATYGTSVIGAAQNFLGTTNANDVTVGTNNIERMRVKNTTGFIGIGTANPATPLEVVSNGVNEFRLSSRGAFGTSRFSMISDKELASEWRPTYIESADNGSYTGRMDFYTNGTGVANKFGSVRAMSISNGNVGIGRTDPSIKLDILASGNSNGFRLLSGNNAEISYLSIGRAVGHAQIGSCTAGNFFLDALDGDMAIKNFNAGKILLGASVGANAAMSIIPGGNVGIGTATPTNLLHVNSTTSGAVRIVDGTQAINKVLTSDATGVATWADSKLNSIKGVLGSGVDVSYATGPFLQTNSYIQLPPGRWIINVTMLLRNTLSSYSPNDSYFWLRSTFSESSGASPVSSADIEGSTLISGNFLPSSVFSIIQGTIIINNTSAVTKTYYYVAGNTQFNATTNIIYLYGGNAFLENNILAYRLN